MTCHREYVSGRGLYKGVDISVCSTGIGGPSAIIAIDESSAIGYHTYIRVGSTASVQPEIKTRDMIIVKSAVKMDGTSKIVAPEGYPAAADPVVTLALIQACEDLGYKYHVGVAATTDDFYVGQERPDSEGYIHHFSRSLYRRFTTCKSYEL